MAVGKTRCGVHVSLFVCLCFMLCLSVAFMVLGFCSFLFVDAVAIRLVWGMGSSRARSEEVHVHVCNPTDER